MSMSSVRTRRRVRAPRDEGGYVAILVAALAIPLFAMCAFAVDVGQWYVTAREVQRAADAAALGGVPYLPGDQSKAFAAARELSRLNGYADAQADVSVDAAIAKTPTQLKVSVSKTVPSVFGQLLGVDNSTITRFAVADYAGPVPLGSPCNRYGNDPDETAATASDVCKDVGHFWGNVGSLQATKVSGDAYQNNDCAAKSTPPDGCESLSGPNVDYDVNGYFYSVTLTKDVRSLTIEAFDPALVHVGNDCKAAGTLSKKGPKGTAYAKDLGADAISGSDPSDRYVEGKASPYCTGDVAFSNASDQYSNQVATSFVVRDPGPNAWDPASFPVHSSCEGTGTYPGYAGNLVSVLNKRATAYGLLPTGTGLVPVASEPGYVAKVFRQWKTLCTIGNAKAGTYLVQVKTNGLGFDSGNGHNRFALRAFSATNAADNEAIAISGYSKMTIYANAIGATPEFHLARVPSGAAGQILNVKLFDVGDVEDGASGDITIVPPRGSGESFSDCKASGAYSGPLTGCAMTNVSSRTYQGKWQTISVPIPQDYMCDDREPTACWFRLMYNYGVDTEPTDTTSWAASIEGDPVRLIE
jgi:hypothetical protein